MQTMGERIKILRKDSHITQEELAKVVGLKDRSSIANWEADRVTPDYEQLQKAAKFFNVTIDYIINGAKNVAVAVFTQSDVTLIQKFHAMSSIGQKMILDMMDSIEKMENRK
jgi:transcriptional regulator with XRE-family HTH domain